METKTEYAEQMSGIPQVTDKTDKPKGVISKRTHQYVIVGIAVVILLVAMFSSGRQQKTSAKAKPSAAVSLQDVNERKLADFGNELSEQQRAAEKQRVLTQLPPPSNPATTNGTLPKLQPGSAQSTSAVGYGYASSYAAQGESAREDPLKERERERAYNSRFASNFAFAVPVMTAQNPRTEPNQPATVTAQRDDPPLPQILQKRGAEKKQLNVQVNSATGQPYVLFEGTTIETTLMNRLDGEFSGPVKVMVANPVYSHDRQHVLIPDGSTILGEVKPVEGLGQRRLAVVFHRLLMPDGYSVDLDQFEGLSQEGATGLKDKINNHYMQIFGTSVALGVIAGAAEGSVGTVGVYQNGVDAYRAGVASSVSQSSTRVLDRFLSISPTLTIREGQRVKVYLTQDLLLPAYENHTVPPNI